MEKYLERGDLINGRHGHAVAITEDGRREVMFYLKDISVDVDITNTSLKRMGTMQNINFQGSTTTDWSATMYRSTRFFRDMVVKYLHEGVETRFDLILMQDDPNHEAGEETLIAKNCLINRATLISLDIESDTAIEEAINGTFEQVEVR